MPRALAEGKTKVALLSVKPADPYAPTVAELEAGLDISCAVMSSDYSVAPAASETVDEKPLCVEGNAVTFGASNATIEFTLFREFNEDGSPVEPADDEIGDAAFQATKTKGTRLWIYQRETAKKSRDAWEAGDEVDGFEFITDHPQQVDRTGYVKRRIVGGFQDLYVNGVVAGGGSGE